MSRVATLLTTLVLVQASLGAQGTRIEDLPHAFPREGAKRVLANEWLTAWDATWIPDKPTITHRHLYDYFGVELADSRTNSTDLAGQTRTVSLRRGQGWFLPKGGAAHFEVGLTANPPRRAIIVDLSDKPSPSFDNPTRLPDAFPTDGAQKMIDKERVVMWDRMWAAGQKGPMQFYTKNAVVIVVDGGELALSAPDQAPTVSSFVTGDVLFLPGGRAHSISATSAAVRAVVVALK
jgi:hypothetical protein